MKTFIADALAVRVYPSQTDLAHDAAHEAHRILREAVERRGRARAILASATSQVKFLEALVNLPGLDWRQVTLFHMDEYLGINDQHPASFRRFMRERVEGKVHPQIFHYLQGDALLPIKECERYGGLIQGEPIDLCCLGIGENGHIAFNDPAVADFGDDRAVKLVQLDEPCRRQQVGEGAFPDLASVPQYAYTLTIPALCSAMKLIAVVPEQRKAQAVRSALRGPIDTACPASILRRQGHATLFLDTDSASQL